MQKIFAFLIDHKIPADEVTLMRMAEDMVHPTFRVMRHSCRA